MSKAKEILDIIREAIEKHPEFGYTTPTLYDPEKLDFKVSVGLIEKTEEGDRLRFNISVDDNMYHTNKDK